MTAIQQIGRMLGKLEERIKQLEERIDDLEAGGGDDYPEDSPATGNVIPFPGREE